MRFFTLVLLLAAWLPTNAGLAAANDLPDCSERIVTLMQHNATVQVCRAPTVKGDQFAFAMGVAVRALPRLENLLGGPYERDRLRIDFGLGESPPQETVIRLSPELELANLDRTLIQGMARLFWGRGEAPEWFVNAGAGFAANVIKAEIRFMDPRAVLDERSASLVRTLGEPAANLPPLSQVDPGSEKAAWLGELLLIDLYYFLGPSNLERVFQDLYTEKRDAESITNRHIIEALNRHCPEDIRCRLWKMIASRLDDSLSASTRAFWYCSFWPYGAFAVLLLVALPYVVFLVYRLRRQGAGKRA